MANSIGTYGNRGNIKTKYYFNEYIMYIYYINYVLNIYVRVFN